MANCRPFSRVTLDKLDLIAQFIHTIDLNTVGRLRSLKNKVRCEAERRICGPLCMRFEEFSAGSPRMAPAMPCEKQHTP